MIIILINIENKIWNVMGSLLLLIQQTKTNKRMEMDKFR